ncbi:hypothetical protein K435DRAFT_156881 [Dendrothele bispora CBS 962.96]|uniref:Uncharacterized protein n=1 Tax=Dendrothele bispora (strain CBS 962.96) TaxID=1314807 RepID=A0A4V4HAQ9_DENBC|nr:hypothetical protein K435DRAFT_156881 [Dendrothele bispora CBS 962.96]
MKPINTDVKLSTSPIPNYSCKFLCFFFLIPLIGISHNTPCPMPLNLPHSISSFHS